jgi:hypothetical protein
LRNGVVPVSHFPAAPTRSPGPDHRGSLRQMKTLRKPSNEVALIEPHCTHTRRLEKSCQGNHQYEDTGLSTPIALRYLPTLGCLQVLGLPAVNVWVLFNNFETDSTRP